MLVICLSVPESQLLSGYGYIYFLEKRLNDQNSVNKCLDFKENCQALFLKIEDFGRVNVMFRPSWTTLDDRQPALTYGNRFCPFKEGTLK